MLPGILTTEVAEKTHGKTASGVPITDKLVAKLADKAEAGYSVDAMLRRRGGRVRSRHGGVARCRWSP